MINSFFPPFDGHKDEQSGGESLNLTRIISVQLLTTWYACGQATGARAFGAKDKHGNWTTFISFQENYLLGDPDGIINADPLAQEDTDGNVFLPQGTICKVHLPDESQDNHYELLTSGTNCPTDSGSGSGSSSSGSGSGSSGVIPCYPVSGNSANFPIIPDPDFILAAKRNSDGTLCWCLTPTVLCPPT